MKRTIRLSERELHRVIKESVRRLISEDINPEYDGYVLIDEASEEVIQNYSFDELQDAINDAKSMGRGRFLVVGCRGNEYDLNDVVFDSNPDSSYKFENIVRKAVKESVRRILRENVGNDDFTPHGYFTTSNYGGYEVEISNSGDAARFRQNFGDGPGEVTDWCEIQYDENGNAYCDTPFGVQELGNYMRYQ